MTTTEEFLTQEWDEKDHRESIFYNIRSVDWDDCGVVDDDIFSREQMAQFAKAYAKEQLKKVFDNYGIGFIGKAHYKHDFESWYKDFHKSNSLKP